MHLRRIGKFRVAGMFVQPENDLVRRLMAKIIVLDVIRHFNMDAIEYVAYCDDFEPVEYGYVPPEYDVICSGDPIVVSFRPRQLNGLEKP